MTAGQTLRRPWRRDRIGPFERYYRAVTGKKAEGLGVGLYIARLIVEAHGGRAWVESQVGQGSIFSLSLPLG